MPRKEQINWAKMLEEIEFEEGRQASGKRQVREDKLDAAREKQLGKNRKREWTVFLQGGAPQ
jgi:hypothetical protein